MNNLEQTIISQYANSPILLAVLTSLNQSIDPTADFNTLFNMMWNINTAVGYGLDVWGRIVGIDRYIVIPGNTLFLGFKEAGTWQDFGYGVLWDGDINELTQSSVKPMSDNVFRQAILAKALSNISNCSAPAINKILTLLFGGPYGPCYVIDNCNMSFDLHFMQDIPDTSFYTITQKNIIPKPAGVQAYLYTPTRGRIPISSTSISVSGVAPSGLVYSSMTLTLLLNAAMTPDYPSVTGSVNSYSVSPALPAGVSLNTSTGVISGTPTSTSSATNYTVTATNSYGSTSCVLSFSVSGVAPSGLSYAYAPILAVVGGAITSDSPSVTGAVTSFSISPALPAGLNISSTTGVISGTPTTAKAATTYTVTATNLYGSTTTTISITVSALVVPSGLTYSTQAMSAVTNVAITNDVPALAQGVASTYSVSPALPAGLSINTTTGIISGTPTTASSITSYTVTATNSAGSTTDTITIVVTASTGGSTPTAVAAYNAAIGVNTVSGVSVQAGDYIMVVMNVSSSPSGSTRSCADSGGNSYTQIDSGSPNNYDVTLNAFYAIAQATATLTVTATCTDSPSSFQAVDVVVVRGAYQTPSSVIDGHAWGPSELTTPATSHVSGSLTTTNASDLVLAFWGQGYAGQSSPYYTDGSGFSLLNSTQISAVFQKTPGTILSGLVESMTTNAATMATSLLISFQGTAQSGGGGGGGGSTVTVSISPSYATAIISAGTLAFTANVTGSSSATSWSVDGIAGGNSTVGTISSTGGYQAPSTSVPTMHTITATNSGVAASTSIVVAGGTTKVTTAADPTGTSDSTSAINACIASAGSGIAYVPAGTFLINPTANVSSTTGLDLPSGVTLLLDPGCTLQAITQSSGGSQYRVIRIAGSNTAVVGGTILGDRAAHGSTIWTNGDGIDFNACSNAIVLGTFVGECMFDCMYVYNGASNIQLVNVTANHGSRQGLSVVAGTYVTAVGCTFSNTQGQDPGFGVDLEPSSSSLPVSHCTFTSCNFTGNKGGGMGHGFSGTTCDSNSVVNCIFNANGGQDYGVGGIHANDSASNGVITGCTFTNNTGFTGGDTGGVRLENVSGYSVTHNIFNNNMDYDIYLYECSGTTVSNNGSGVVIDNVGGSVSNPS